MELCGTDYQLRLEVSDENASDSNHDRIADDARAAREVTDVPLSASMDTEDGVDEISSSLAKTHIISSHISFGRVGRRGRVRSVF